MLYQTAIIDDYIYLLDNYWGKAYFGGYAPNSKRGFSTRGIDIPSKIAFAGNEYQVIEVLESAMICTYFLTHVSLPDSIQRIGDYAFHRCDRELTEVILPNKLKLIGEHAFDGCSRLESIKIPQLVSEISDSCFYDCNSLSDIQLPSRLLRIGNFAFYACKALNRIVIPDTVAEIGECAFAFCYGIKSFTLPKNLQYIDNTSFLQNKQIEEITLKSVQPPIILRHKLDKFDFNYYFKQAVLRVPKESLELYNQAEGWKSFINIEGY